MRDAALSRGRDGEIRVCDRQITVLLSESYSFRLPVVVCRVSRERWELTLGPCLHNRWFHTIDTGIIKMQQSLSPNLQSAHFAFSRVSFIKPHDKRKSIWSSPIASQVYITDGILTGLTGCITDCHHCPRVSAQLCCLTVKCSFTPAHRAVISVCCR